jgi:hypothetical protein
VVDSLQFVIHFDGHWDISVSKVAGYRQEDRASILDTALIYVLLILRDEYR